MYIHLDLLEREMDTAEAQTRKQKKGLSVSLFCEPPAYCKDGTFFIYLFPKTFDTEKMCRVVINEALTKPKMTATDQCHIFQFEGMLLVEVQSGNYERE